MKTKRSRPRIVGYEILRRVEPGEVSGHPLDPRKDRAVLGAREKRYLVPPDVDVFELGLIDRPGPHELLPIDENDRPLWDDVIHLLVGEAEAARQRELLRMAYRALCGMIVEADELEASVAEQSRRREAHPIFGMLRLAMIEVWAARRRGLAQFGVRELGALHAEVARRVAARIRAHVVGPKVGRRRRR
ncbi:MAG TPA: hypothetical protein VGO79_09485 [Thermoanaerobaculia bacterium]